MDIPLLWHIPLSHYNEKVRWALDYKGIAHHRRVLGADYLIRAWRATGQGKLPILWLDGRAIADSTRIIAALEERYPEPALWPADPAERARGRLLVERFDSFSRPYYALRRGEEDARERLDQQLASLDDLLAGRPYLTGREFGLADIAYLPWILRAESNLGVDLGSHSALADWVERVSERPSVAAERVVLAAL